MTSSPAGTERVLMIIPSLQAGGAERVMAILANALADIGHQIHLATLTDSDTPDHYSLSASIERTRLQVLCITSPLRRLLQAPRAVTALRRLLRENRPDIVLSFLDITNFQVLLAARGLDIPVVVSERMDPRFHRWPTLRSLLRRCLYPRARGIVVQTGRVAASLPASLQDRISIIPNPVPLADNLATPERPNTEGRFRIVSLARLHRQKGLDRLIAAFASVADAFPQWDVAIFGQGPEETALRRKVTRHGLEGRIFFGGLARNIADELVTSHLFVLPSRFEGFPNALAEAMAHGLPAIGYRNVSGVEDLIDDGKSGYLVVSKAAKGRCLTDALATLMDNAPRRAAMGRHGRDRLARICAADSVAPWRAILFQPPPTNV